MKSSKAAWAALFLLGFLVGASLTTLQTGRELDRLHVQISELRGELEDKENLINLLSGKLSSQKKTMIEKITLHVILPDRSWANHQTIKETLEQDLKKILNPTLGQPIEQVKPGLIQALLHQRILPTAQGNFLIKMDWLIIAPTLECQVSARLE
jgi:hypothetical protein